MANSSILPLFKKGLVRPTQPADLAIRGERLRSYRKERTPSMKCPLHLLELGLALFLPGCLLALFLSLLQVSPAHAGSITVDGTTCTLADAITAANTDAAAGSCPAGSGDDTLGLSSGGIYTLTTSLPSITTTITISGNGATIIRDPGAPSFSIFHVGATGALTLDNVTISNGDDGGIYNSGGVLTVTASSVVSNTGFNGGGIGGYGTTFIARSVISGNTATNFGGGIDLEGTLRISDTLIAYNTAPSASGGGLVFAHPDAPARIVNSTIYTNTGGGIMTGYNGKIIVENSTVSGNDVGVGFGSGDPGTMAITMTYTTVTANEVGITDFDCPGCGSFYYASSIVAGNTTDCDVTASTLTSGGYSLVGDTTACNAIATGDQSTTDPGLGPLQDNGGPTPTHALHAGSPAIDQIPVSTNGCKSTITTDQRGAVRADGSNHGGSACDMGAYEYDSNQTPTVVKLVSFSGSGLVGGISPAGLIATIAALSAGVATTGGVRLLRRRNRQT